MYKRQVFIGAAPRTDWLPPAILRDEKGFLLAGPDLRTDGKLPPEWREQRDPFLLESSVAGVFVAGDVRHGSVKRVASAVGEGSIAVQFVPVSYTHLEARCPFGNGDHAQRDHSGGEAGR